MRKLKLQDYIILITSIASFFVAFISSAPAVALPQLAAEFSLNNIMQNWVINIFLFTVAIVAVPFGKFSGMYGIKKSYNIGLILFLIGSILSAIAFSTESLLVFRAFQGIAAAILYNTVTSLVSVAVPEQIRGKALGIMVSAVYIGLAVAPFIGGILTDYLGWRAIFYFSIPFILITLLISLTKVKDEWSMYKNETFDIKGSILYGVSIFLLVYGFTIINEPNGLILAIIGAILLIAFIYLELKVKYPVFNVRVFKNTKFLSSNLASIISYIATFLVTYVLNYHFQYILGYNETLTGVLLLVTPLLMAIASPISGNLSDKINPQKLAAIGMAFVTLALFILIFLNAETPLYVIIVAMVLQGIGFGIFASPNTNLVMSTVEPKETPTASVTITVMRVVGQTLSLAMLTVIFAIIMGNVAFVPENFPQLIESSSTACIISTILCAIAILASLWGLKSKNIN